MPDLILKRTVDGGTVLVKPPEQFRGAPMGRASRGEPGTVGAKFNLSRVRLDRGGYDETGAYWGLGQALWTYCDGAGRIEGFLRSPDRGTAKEAIRAIHPGARFWR